MRPHAFQGLCSGTNSEKYSTSWNFPAKAEKFDPLQTLELGNEGQRDTLAAVNGLPALKNYLLSTFVPSPSSKELREAEMVPLP